MAKSAEWMAATASAPATSSGDFWGPVGLGALRVGVSPPESLGLSRFGINPPDSLISSGLRNVGSDFGT